MQINYDELLDKAKEVSKNSYSPYSKFKVGAAVIYESGNVYLGVNVENVSYGITLCAERCAISSAIAAGEKTKIAAIAVYSPNQKNCLPCGACRQWLAEFAPDNTHDLKIVLEGCKGESVAWGLDEIFPDSFKFTNCEID